MFLDIPARNELSLKEKEQTSLVKTISDTDSEINALVKQKADLEKEIPLIPEKINEHFMIFIKIRSFLS